MNATNNQKEYIESLISKLNKQASSKDLFENVTNFMCDEGYKKDTAEYKAMADASFDEDENEIIKWSEICQNSVMEEINRVANMPEETIAQASAKIDALKNIEVNKVAADGCTK